MTRSTKPDRADEQKAAAAQNVFVREAWSALPPKARRQLFSRRTETELLWATRWQVNAPCMVSHARELRALQASFPDEPLGRKLRRGLMRIDVRISVPPPPGWLAELERLDRLRDWRLSDKVVPSQALDEYSRRKLADDEDLLARPGLNPDIETDEEYLQRAAAHCRARRLRFQRFVPSGRPPKPSPKLNQHIEWLVAFQVRGTDVAAIARHAGLVGAAGQARVRKTLHGVARLIGLVLRREPRDPRRVTPASTLQAAKLLRAELTRRFQEVRSAGSGLTGPLYEAEIKNAIDEHLPNCSPEQSKVFLQQLKSGHLKPSDAAVRLSARKFSLPVRQVRTGRVSVPRRRGTRRVEPFEAWELRRANLRRRR